MTIWVVCVFTKRDAAVISEHKTKQEAEKAAEEYNAKIPPALSMGYRAVVKAKA